MTKARKANPKNAQKNPHKLLLEVKGGAISYMASTTKLKVYIKDFDKKSISSEHSLTTPEAQEEIFKVLKELYGASGSISSF